jgi:predicted NAD/FAD-dependent oxidoreductase
VQPIATQPNGIAARVRMRGCWSVMLRHAAPLALPFDATFINGGALRWIARDSSKPGRPHRTAAAHIAATNLKEALVLTKPNGPMSEQGCE